MEILKPDEGIEESDGGVQLFQDGSLQHCCFPDHGVKQKG